MEYDGEIINRIGNSLLGRNDVPRHRKQLETERVQVIAQDVTKLEAVMRGYRRLG